MIALGCFTACEDVPAPYFIQEQEENDPSKTGIFLSETFASSLGKFKVVTEEAEGYSWANSYSTAYISGYQNSVNKATKTWLVSPSFDLTGQDAVQAVFDYVLRYKRTTTKELLRVSADYVGDVTTATWYDLDIKMTEGKDYTTFYSTGANLPAEVLNQPNVVVALYYEAGDKEASTWEVKNLMVKKGEYEENGNGTTPTNDTTREKPFSVSQAIASQNGNIVYFNGKAVKYFNGTGGRILPADTKVEHNVDKYNPKRDYYYVKISYNSFVKVTPVYYTDEELAALQTSSALFKNLYDFTFNRSRRIYVNKNPQGTGREVNDKVGYEIHGNASYYDGKYHDDMSKIIQTWYNDNIKGMKIKFDDVKAIAKYCSGKGISIRTLLNSVGINTSSVPQNANLVTSKAIDGSNGDADRVFREVYYEKTFYMGINIDQVGATEQKYQLLDCGWNLWKGGEEWNYAPGGAFCWI